MAYDFEESSGQRIKYSTVHADYTSSVSISFWLKAESNPGSHQTHFVDKGSDSSGDRNISVGWTPASGGLWFISFSDSSNNYSEWTAAGSPTTGSWINCYLEVDWTTNPDTFLFWVNNSTVTLSNTFGTNDRVPSTDATQHISIGGEHGSDDNVNNTDGLLAEVAFWSDIVGSTRAAGLYNSGAGGRADVLYPTNLVEYIRLKDDPNNSKGGSGTLSSSAPTLSSDHPFVDPTNNNSIGNTKTTYYSGMNYDWNPAGTEGAQNRGFVS